MPPKPNPKPALTHFLSIPLHTSSSHAQLRTSLSPLHASLLTPTAENPNAVPEKTLRPLGTLHLTLGVMSLATPERIREAVKVLREVNLGRLIIGGKGLEGGGSRGDDDSRGDTLGVEKKKHQEEKKSVESPTAQHSPTPESSPRAEDAQILRPRDEFRAVRITLKGLKSMGSDSKTSVLYTTPVDEDGGLLAFCERLRDVFAERGFLAEVESGQRAVRKLLLHATLVNTVYVRGRGRGGGKGKKLLLDARELVRVYEQVEWMRDVRVEKVTICRMGAVRRENGDEEYIVEGEVEMPV